MDFDLKTLGLAGAAGEKTDALVVLVMQGAASGKDAPLGAEGELIVRGPNVMLGYHNKPAETEVALREGWYRTGDLGILASGRLASMGPRHACRGIVETARRRSIGE